MCVIIHRDPGIVIPYDKIATACQVNPDGWGFLALKDGELIYQRGYSKTGNAPEEIYPLLEEYIDCDIALHLRFTTAGEKNVENCHPYVVLEKETDGVDLYFMHNGTLSDFRKQNTKMSDSYNFVQAVLKPLLRTARQFYGEDYLKQEYVQTIIAEFKGASVFTFMDNEGNTLQFENTSCKDHKGWWSSNTYSFTPDHRTSSYSNYGYGQNNYRSTQQTKGGGDSCSVPFRAAATSTSGDKSGASTGKSTTAATPTSATNNYADDTSIISVTTVPRTAHMTESLKQEADRIKDVIREVLENDPVADVISVSHIGGEIPTFEEISGFTITDLKMFSFDDLYDMVDQFPEAATILLREVLHAKPKVSVPAVVSKVG